MSQVLDVLKRAGELGEQRLRVTAAPEKKGASAAAAECETPSQDIKSGDSSTGSPVDKAASDEPTYTLREALEIFSKGAKLVVAEKEAAEHAQQSGKSVDEQAVMYARDLLKSAATLHAES